MTRPSSHADLSDYQTQGDCIINWYSELGKYPEVEQHIVAAKLAARKLGFEVTATEVRAPKSTKALDATLMESQDRFDRGLNLYADILTGLRTYEDMTWTERNAAEYYATREGIVAPDKVESISTLSARADEQV